ncbi:MAG: hypothetical protein KDD66_01790 [Bdellovibrionales bacterium]|nr:hypothetical protein [Bdellovibrionales bacterium]
MRKLLVLFVLIGVAGAAVLLLRPQLLSKLGINVPGGSSTASADEISHTVLMALAQEGIIGPDLKRQILGDADIAGYIVDSGEVYFTHPKSDDKFAVSRSFQRFCADVTKVGMLENESGRIEIPGGYVLRVDPKKKVVLVMSEDNFKVDPEMQLEFAYDGCSYKLTPRVLDSYLSNRAVYGGHLRMQIPGSRRAFYNHGAFVAKPDEPSLAAFVNAVTARANPKDDNFREQRIQAWSAFVCGQIEYSDFEAWADVETLKRPNEVLMSRESDCSGKAILMASGLEQMGEEYLLCYYDGHIAVAVPQGQFLYRNGLGFKYQGRQWVLCETAVRGGGPFFIGVTELELRGRTRDELPRYVQQPKDGRIIDVASGSALKHS